MRYERLTTIGNRHGKLLALLEKEAYSSSQLAQELNVSEQTIYRDVSFLKGQGHTIVAMRLPTCWGYQLNAARQPKRAPRNETI